MSPQKENELICEKLLGWKRGHFTNEWSSSAKGLCLATTPTFTDWASAGLILEALAARPDTALSLIKLSLRMRDAQLSPLAIRAAALAYLNGLSTGESL